MEPELHEYAKQKGLNLSKVLETALIRERDGIEDEIRELREKLLVMIPERDLRDGLEKVKVNEQIMVVVNRLKILGVRKVRL